MEPRGGCSLATIGVMCSAAFAADSIAAVLVAVGAAMPVGWALCPDRRTPAIDPRNRATTHTIVLVDQLRMTSIGKREPDRPSVFLFVPP